MNMKRILPLLLSLAMALALCACGSQSSSDGAQTSVSGSTGVEDGVLTVGMECAYAPYNWTQMDDSNGAVPISGKDNLYASGYDVQVAKYIAAELGMALVNRKLAGIETLFLPADPILEHISSSIVKDVARHGGDVTGMVPDCVVPMLADALAEERQRKD